jgi:bis(5'-nucleosyl)-tetraphosphatase (symmetrical)
MGLTAVIGDIHGCLDEFDELRKKIGLVKGTDRVVLLGDLIDRGPDSVGVVRRAMEMNDECILGNHEEKHLRFPEGVLRVA